MFKILIFQPILSFLSYLFKYNNFKLTNFIFVYQILIFQIHTLTMITRIFDNLKQIGW